MKVERCVARLEIDALIDAFDERIAAGHLYGDFQFATAPDSPEFLRTGVLSSYRPVADDRQIPERPAAAVAKRLEPAADARAQRQTRRLRANSPEFYLATHGQLYWSDTHQLNLYLEDYHGALDHRLGAAVRGSEMITELYVPRSAPAGVHERRAPRFPAEWRRLHLRHHPTHRSRDTKPRCPGRAKATPA